MVNGIPSGHKYKQKYIFYIQWITNVFGLYSMNLKSVILFIIVVDESKFFIYLKKN
jgi:hypothetical protein